MTLPLTVETAHSPRRRDLVQGLGLVLVVAIVGLFLVKWQPYYLKTLIAATNHSLGASILTGTSAAPPSASRQAAWSYATAYFLAVWQAVVLGLVLAATIEASVPPSFLARILGGIAARSSLFGGLLALPGMMCTCCSAPVVVGLRRAGASVEAATTFFLGNPTLNPAVLVFLLFTLGWQWAVLRLVLGLALVAGGAALAARFGGTVGALPSAEAPASVLTGPWLKRWLAALGRLVIQLLPEYLVIVGLLGFARAFLFPAAGAELGNTPFLLVALAVAGTLFVIPTAGEIPIIQTLQAFGLAAGPAGVLLLTLAPVSLPSLVMVGRVLPWRLLVLLAGLTMLVGLASGAIATILRL